MQDRQIIKLLVQPGIQNRINEYLERTGLFSHSLNSRLFEWFADQDETVQVSILGLLPSGIDINTTRLILEPIAARAKSTPKPKARRRK